MIFWMGTHRENWIECCDHPLFVSHSRLRRRKRLPRSIGPVAIDSCGFSELSMHGKWTITPQEYVRAVRRYSEEVGIVWAAQQDWMCEPFVREKTGLSVVEHQRRTVENFLRLMDLAPDLPWVPVLQGWKIDDYFDHLEMFAESGIRLAELPLVGLGSVCRRQATDEIEELVTALWSAGLKLHGFGVKKEGLARIGGYLESADSMAWSRTARYDEPLPGHTHKNCANCLDYALLWRQKVLAGVQTGEELQPLLW
mgnify:CR=1 FL=1